MGLLHKGIGGGLSAIGAYARILDKRRAIWAKAHPIFGEDRNAVRRDDDNRVIHFDCYGNRDSPYGWEFDHYPVAKCLGGTDDISNLRPLHWQGNASRGGLLGDVLDDLNLSTLRRDK